MFSSLIGSINKAFSDTVTGGNDLDRDLVAGRSGEFSKLPYYAIGAALMLVYIKGVKT